METTTDISSTESARPETIYGAFRPQTYYAIKKPSGFGHDLFVSAGLLIRRFGVSEKTIRNGISKCKNGLTSYYHAFIDKGALMLNYDEALPPNIKTKIRMPKDSKAAYELLRAEYEMEQDINRDLEVNHLRDTFRDLYDNKWPRFLKFYNDNIKVEAERILYAKSHALIEGVLDAYKSKWPTEVIFDCYQKVIRNEIDALAEPVFFTVSKVYFWRKISRCRLDGIPAAIIHDARGEQRDHQVKMTGAIQAFMRILCRDARRFTVAAIKKRVLAKFKVELSDSSIKSLKKKNLDRQVLEYDSDGKIHGRQNGLPKVTRFLAEGPGEQFQGDFYKLQFYCRSVTGTVIRLWAYVVLDVHSKKYVGWAIGEKPSATMAKNAFKMAFVEHCILPEEIIVDNDKLYLRKIFVRFLRRLNNLGVITTKAYANIPTWKAEIESSFAVFQKIHADKPWYIGESVKSKNIAGNPAPEFVKQLYAKVSSMLSVKEMTSEWAKMVEEYNAMTNDRKKKISPRDTYRMNKSKRTQPLQDWMVPLLFWKAKTKKRIKDDGRIDLQIDGVEYCYQVTEAETLWTFKNSDVRMCYDPKDMSVIHLFERGTLNYIGKIEPRMVMTRNNKKDVMKKQRRVLFEAQKYLKDARQKDEDIVNGKNGRAPVKRETLENKIIKRKMKEKKFEATVAKVPVHP